MNDQSATQDTVEGQPMAGAPAAANDKPELASRSTRKGTPMDLQLFFVGIALLLIVVPVWVPLVGLAIAVADLLCHTMASKLFGRSRLGRGALRPAV
jgi:hypothetical protein